MRNALKMLSLALSLALIATMLLGLAVPALAYTDGNLEAPKAKDVVIDGDLSEWDLSRSLKVVEKAQIIDQIEHWDGEADCSMETYVMCHLLTQTPNSTYLGNNNIQLLDYGWE